MTPPPGLGDLRWGLRYARSFRESPFRGSRPVPEDRTVLLRKGDVCATGHFVPRGTTAALRERIVDPRLFAVTIPYLSPPPPADRLVWHAPHRGSADIYDFVPAPALRNAAVRPFVPGGVGVVSEIRGIHVAGSFALERQVGTERAYLQPAALSLRRCSIALQVVVLEKLLLTKPPTPTSGAFRYYGICRPKKRADERTRTGDLISSYE